MAGYISLSYESTFHFSICPFVIYVFSYESFVCFSRLCLYAFRNSTFLFVVISFVNESLITMSLSAFPFINVSQNHISACPRVILMLVCKSSFVLCVSYESFSCKCFSYVCVSCMSACPLVHFHTCPYSCMSFTCLYDYTFHCFIHFHCSFSFFLHVIFHLSANLFHSFHLYNYQMICGQSDKCENGK